MGDRAGRRETIVRTPPRYAAGDLGRRDPDPAGGSARIRIVFFRHPHRGARPRPAECHRARFPAGRLHDRHGRDQHLPHLHHRRDGDPHADHLVPDVPHPDRNAGARHHPESLDGGRLRHRCRPGQCPDLRLRLGSGRRCGRDDVRLQDRLPGHGHVDGRRRLHGRRHGRRRQSARRRRLGWHPRRDQRRRRLRDKRHSCPGRRVRRGDPDHRAEDPGPVFLQGARKQ